MRFIPAAWMVGLALCGYPVWASTRVFFTSQESVEKDLVRLIDESSSSIDMALFRFTSLPLARAIARARDRGTRIRIVLDGHAEADQGPHDAAAYFKTGEIRRVNGKLGGMQGVMHHKFVIFDQRRLVTGSFNWTAGAEHVNYEDALLTDEKSVVAAYSGEFEKLWLTATPVSSGINQPVPVNPNHPRKTHHGRNSRRIQNQSQKNQPLQPPRQPTAKKKHRKKKKNT